MCSNCSGDYENPDATTPDDLDEQSERDQLIAAIQHEERTARVLKIIRKAAVSHHEEGGFLGQHLRDRGIL
jgi:hypothetical protein